MKDKWRLGRQREKKKKQREKLDQIRAIKRSIAAVKIAAITKKLCCKKVSIATV